MLHRMALRVLPSLTLAVTEGAVRQRKRLVMLLPGLVAFFLYRIVKPVMPVDEIGTLLAMSGVICLVTAAWAYRVGRDAPAAALWQDDGLRRLIWVLGWVGFIYGVQLSLMVLALLKLAHYDYRLHPEGPAMMAVIIACTSVARDAFEIGYVRRLQRRGEPVLTFPDGAALRALLRERAGAVLRWMLPAMTVGALLAGGAAWIGAGGRSPLSQLAVVSVVAGSLTVLAYLAGDQRSGSWSAVMTTAGWPALFRFWWWPGLAFAATYYLTLDGLLSYVFRLETLSPVHLMGMAGVVAGLMAMYGYYLGYRRHVEDQVKQVVPDSLLRCPFVMGILSKTGNPQPAAIGQQLQKLGADGLQGRRG